MRVIDCFPYFNEKELLELRINLLYDKVDKFIICDANKTHKGTSKPFTCKNTLQELGLLSDKIQVVEVNLPSYDEESDAWVRERAQRNAAAEFIQNDDVCIVSDCDEIINPNYVEYYVNVAQNHPQNILRIPLAFLMGRGDLRTYDESGKPVPWNVSYVCLKHHLEKYTLSDIRESHALSTHHIVYPDTFTYDNGVLEDAGWHFTWMGDENRIKTKSESFLHWDEVSIKENYTPKENSTDCLGRKNHILKKYPINLLPEKVFELSTVRNYLFKTKIDRNDSQMNKIYLKPYYGYGDWISLNGMIRFFSLKYDEVILVSELSDLDFIKNLFKDDKKIKVIYGCLEQEFNSSYDYVNLEIWKQNKNSKANYYDKYNPIGYKFGFEVLNIPDEAYERIESPHNFHKEYKDVLENNASSFYIAAGIPKEYRINNFYYEREYESENSFFEKLNLPDEYIVVCEYGENLIDRKFIQNKNLFVININNISEKYFDVIKIIENAKEVHLIENSFALLVYHLQCKKLMKNVKINIHTYARNEHVRRCTSSKESNMYLDMFRYPHLENWNFIYLDEFMKRTDIINTIIKKINAKKYLEIGISDGNNFLSIDCDYKIGIDPSLETPATLHLTSDDFFEQNKETFDVIFIDGLHHADQVYKDINNSLMVLNDGGYIVCHDMNPLKEEHQTIPYQGGTWNGDCWKAFARLRMERGDLEMYTVDTDHGCSIITKGSQEILNLNYPMTYYYLEQNRKKLLNLISPKEFLSKFVDNEQHNLSELLYNYVYDPENPDNNFALGLYYDGIGQTATALSYYLRCAERTDHDLLKYECLIRGAMCFDKQGARNFTVKSLLLHALALCPHRPEAYYLMSCFYEKENKDGSWNESYTIASIGLKVSELNPPPLKTTIDYPGEYALHFRKAVASWWCGLCEESKKLHLELLDNYEMTPTFRQNAIDNLKRMNVNIKPFAVYTKDKFDKLKIKFNGSENIQENYSESYQDMFVLTMLNGKKNGTYLEIGAGNAFYGNNTALLEKEFRWKGVALDIDEGFVAAHTNERSNPCLLKDATKINYVSFLNGMGFSNDIDYLQLDCDPPEVTYKILLSMPFDTHKFAVITYEHDYYCDETKSFQEKSRRYLESYGYIRVVNNISPDENKPYEDWWVHPELVDKNIINKMLNISDETKKAENYILNL